MTKPLLQGGWAPPAPAAPPAAPRLLALVQSHVPGARLVEELPHELVLALPYEGALDGSFAGLFRDLDLRLGALGLTGYGISDTSLEEVRLPEGRGLPGGGGGLCFLTAGQPREGRLRVPWGGLGDTQRLSPRLVSPDLPEGDGGLCWGLGPKRCGRRALSSTPNPGPELALASDQVLIPR